MTSEEFDPKRDEDESPREEYPNPTQQRIDEDKRRREQGGWEETEHPAHEGEQGQEPV